MKLFGIASHSPLSVKKLVIEAYKERGEKCRVYSLPVGSPLNEKTKKSASKASVLFLRQKEFLSNIDEFNSKKYYDKPVFIFSSILRLSEIEGINVLDNDRLLNYSFRFLDLDKNDLSLACFKAKDSGEIKRPNQSFLSKLVEDTMEGSLLSPLMTMIYQLPASMQTSFKSQIFDWLASSGNSQDLRTTLTRSRKLPESYLDSILTLLEKKFVNTYRKAIRFVLDKKKDKKPVSYKQVMTKFAVSRYELTYIIMVLTKNKKYQEICGKTVEEIFYGRERNEKLAKEHKKKPR